MALKFYKKGQGYYTRLGTALAGGLMAALGCWALYQKLGVITTGNVITPQVKSWLQAGIPLALFAIIAWGILKLINMVKFADFLIATEGEMKKVSWSTKKEIFTSTKVVVFTVAIVAILLAVFDTGFASLFRWIGVLESMPS